MASVKFEDKSLRSMHRHTRSETMVPSPLNAPRYRVDFKPKKRGNWLGRMVDRLRDWVDGR